MVPFLLVGSTVMLQPATDVAPTRVVVPPGLPPLNRFLCVLYDSGTGGLLTYILALFEAQ